MLSSLDDTDESIADADCDDQVNDDNNADDTELSTEPTKLKETVIETLSSDGWNFSHLEEAGTVFPGGLSLTTPSTYTPIITHSGVGPAPLWKLNYPALSYYFNEWTILHRIQRPTQLNGLASHVREVMG